MSNYGKRDPDDLRRVANARWANERGNVGKHVGSVVKRWRVLTPDERARLADALGLAGDQDGDATADK